MKHILIVITGFLLGLISVFLVFRPRTILQFPLSSPKASPTPVSLLIPTHAFRGKIVATTGTVDRIPWDSPDTFTASAGAILYQGDELLTHESATANFTVDEIGTVTMQKTTDLILGSLLPNQIVMQQKNGTILYNASQSTHYVSVRALGALFQFDPAFIATIIVDNPQISVSLASGSATLGYINNDNTTQVWKLQSGDTASINNTTGRVKTTGVSVPNR